MMHELHNKGRMKYIATIRVSNILSLSSAKKKLFLHVRTYDISFAIEFPSKQSDNSSKKCIRKKKLDFAEHLLCVCMKNFFSRRQDVKAALHGNFLHDFVGRNAADQNGTTFLHIAMENDNF